MPRRKFDQPISNFSAGANSKHQLCCQLTNYVRSSSLNIFLQYLFVSKDNVLFP